MNDIKVKLKVSENSVGKKLSLNEALDFSGTLLIYGDTERWSKLGNRISRSGRIYIYSDYTTDENNNPVPGIKIGDGVTSVSDLPFASGWKVPRENHFADNVRHITATERSYWNNSINTLKQHSASAVYTPKGTVSKPSFTGAKATIAVSGTPGGTVSQPTFTGNETKITVTGTPSGSVSVNQTNTTINQVSNVGSTPTMRTYIENGTLKFSFNPGSTPTLSDITIATKVSSATFTGNTLTSNGSTTPSGTVSQPTFTGDKLTSSGEYTPSGDVSKPTFSGETETITSK